MTAGSRAGLRARRLAGPSPETVARLQSVRCYPSVSLLATTTPARRMTAADARTVSRLAEVAVERLRAEAGHGAVLHRLDRTVSKALAGPTGRAIGIFVSTALHEIVPLPGPVIDRVVIDPTFAVRDLVRALNRSPRHVVLMLTEQEALLLDGPGEQLSVPPRAGFPIIASSGPDQRTPEGVDAFFGRVDRALVTHLRRHPAPLILVGAERTLTQFQGLTRTNARLAGTVTGSLTHARLTDLVPRMRAVLGRYLLSRQDDTLTLIDHRRSRHKVVDGIAAAWRAAHAERPEMLAVEEGLIYSARIRPDGNSLVPAADTDRSEVIDDAVDDLIELIIERGGWVSIVADGLLGEHGRVVLTLR